MCDQTTLKSGYVNTKKPHRCIGCYGLFPAPSFMHYWAGLVEGEFQSNYWCMSCTMVLNSRFHDCDMYPGKMPSLKREMAPEMFSSEDEE